MILAILFACFRGEPPSNDAMAYVENRCNDIEDPSLQGECFVFNALSFGYPDAEKHCHYIEDHKWKSECFFLLADTVEEDLNETRRLCERSDFLRNRCLSHWIKGQTQAKLELSGSELMRAANDVATQIVGQEAADSMSKRVLIEVIAKTTHFPFSFADCRGLDELCVDIYLEIVRLQDKKNNTRPILQAHCSQSFSERKEVVQINPDTETVAIIDLAWERACSPSD